MSSAPQRAEYTVLARRFRPQAFADVVGQEHVARTLRNAIIGGRVGHAFLFTGARGVGKTSMARILAKSLNCPKAVGPDPCLDCDVCHGIAVGSDVDVVEIDGASNRGIDDIRQLRANVNVKSMRSKHKVYIIDEVHMLTKEAFNALLKTLEEPPPNVKFIFCTTEPNKVPDTILSRCQRYDFGTIATDSIRDRLRQIATAEGKVVDDEAIQLVARRAAGSMRDSQSLFDQLLAFGAEQITAADVHRLLGTAPDTRLMELVDALITRQRSRILQLFHEALSSGVQLGELTDQLLAYLRDLLLAATGAEGVPLLSVADEHAPVLQQQAQTWGLRTILAALQILADTKGRMQRATYGRVLAEMALIRLSLLEDLDQLADLIPQLKNGNPAASTGGGRTAPAAPRRPAEPSQTNRPATGGPPAARSGESVAPTPPRTERPAEAITATTAPQKTSEPSTVPSEIPAPPASPAHTAFPLEAGNEAQFWAQVLSHINDTLKESAKRGVPSATSGPNHLVLVFPKSYNHARTYCERSASRLQKLAEAVAGHPIQLTFKQAIESEEPVVAATAPPVKTTKRNEHSEQAQRDPMVRKALELFEGKLVPPSS